MNRTNFRILDVFVGTMMCFFFVFIYTISNKRFAEIIKFTPSMVSDKMLNQIDYF